MQSISMKVKPISANYIACGDIGGTLMNGNQLPVGLGTLNDSGYTGVAMLTDDGYGNTTVTVSLIHQDSANAARHCGN